MKIVIDANILFAALIRESTTRKLLFDNRFELYAPSFITEEFVEHLKELETKTNLSAEELKNIATRMIALNITIIEEQEYKELIEQARKITPDPDDVMYIALALKLPSPIWSNDKKLKDQNIVMIYTTTELLHLTKNITPQNN